MPREIGEAIPVELIEWGDFQLGMLQNPTYQRITRFTESQRAVSRVETYFGDEVENWPVAAALWAEMIRGCAVGEGPTENETEAWNAIAQVTNMPIEFTAEGYLTPKPAEGE